MRLVYLLNMLSSLNKDIIIIIIILQNRQADFHETWYVASGTPAHHILFK